MEFYRLATRVVNNAVFVSGTFDVFDVTCKQRHRAALNPFFNSAKNGDVDDTCKRSLKQIVKMYHW